MTTAVFPGSFDPLTLGHLDVIERAHALFDRVIVAIGVNRNKRYRFTVDQRLEMIRLAVGDRERVDVMEMSGALVSFVKEQHADVVIKGIRGGADVEWESPQAAVNREVGGVETLWLPTRPELAHVSSSMVRELLDVQIRVDRYVPSAILALISDNKGVQRAH
ncbi:pantetheine-phosphate adenylyltransferase [Schaalia sp. ZJ1691]|uniref:pantetheine-phosphate adenylyltransferase n=1 Tax=Schaalia sp. ZJ1691 TaxID=2709404 RepID=UPI0013EA4E40|nr:pantetheine-phosphate adenylyltransferase [Schaalia sp. ZJ1691]